MQRVAGSAETRVASGRGLLTGVLTVRRLTLVLVWSKNVNGFEIYSSLKT